ncbi:unnamed protein product [Heligmosomoides polygyrus]|uniref:NADH-plastoquinone oxidoreductase subunit J n=1 Tax=Heligmosomoides polygyrus TaxID=6339 RepID=A0A183GBQ3_HELPZ|nr:unnamed protein product [Heligmosomoides polygyrus]
MEGLVGLGGKSEPGTWYRVHATVAPPPTALHAPSNKLIRAKISSVLGLGLKSPQMGSYEEALLPTVPPKHIW